MVNSSKSLVCSFTNPPKNGLPCVLFLFLVLQSLFIIPINSYSPVENYTISCGTNESQSSTDTRTWVGDMMMNSKVFILIHPTKNQSVSAPASPRTNLQVPYWTARLSHFEFTYSFAVTDGQKFVRLHFHPASYGTFERSNSLFTVKSGGFTLLKDFNVSLVADSETSSQDGGIFREYCINVEPRQRLNITFTPNFNIPDAYAFVNGIEIVSMPTNLYYPEKGLHDVGFDNLNWITNKTALQMMYRVNVGGSQITSEKDTGMFRYWEDDLRYLEKVHRRSLPVIYGHRQPNYTAIPNYTAPNEVYITGRSYGMNETAKYNVSWEFEVDSLFSYMVRLHFCELDPSVQQIGGRVFQIFIDDMLAESRADVFQWTEKNENVIPVYRDYEVLGENRTSKHFNLSIKLQPLPGTVLEDVILNGIEIFKISDYNNNLAGPNPDPLPSLFPPPTEHSKALKKSTVIAVVAGVASSFILLSVIAFLIFRRKSAPENYEKALALAKSSKGHGSSLPTGLCRYFSIDEIRAATNDFDDVLKIGVGGFGIVYKGYIDDNTTPVAIKRLKPGSQQGAVEFKTEIEMLSQLRHLHLVSLIGYCDDGNEMILVYDFMARGTLREHLYDSDNLPLPWKQRLEICLGAAKGLDHLHTGAKYNIIHRDVKSTNILLDEKWVAKVADFGLSKSEPIGMTKSHISTVVKGSLGYVDPEYYKRQRLTQKSDVYSFGVVLLEVLCGRPPLLRTVEKSQTNLVDWVRKCHKNGEIDRAIDPNLRGTITSKCLNKFIEMALHCLLEDGDLRPSMNDLVWGLEFALQLQETKDDTEIGGVEVDGKSQEISSLLPKFVNESSEESDVQFTSTYGSINDSKNSKVTVTSTSSEEQALISGSVFSEIKDPSAR